MVHGIKHKSEYSYIKIQPKLALEATEMDTNFALKLQTDRRRYNSVNNPYTGAHAASIAKRNARERNRVKQVNDGFNALRKRLPSTVVAALSGVSKRGSGTKLSKVDTLRMVVEYIKHLQGVIEESDATLGMKTIDSSFEEGDFCGRISPYTESVPSPAVSESSSGVSSGNSNSSYYHNLPVSENIGPIDENDLFDVMTWW